MLQTCLWPMSDQTHNPIRYQIDDLILDTGTHTLTRNGEELPLTRLSFELFTVLVGHAPQLVTQDDLLTEVWGNAVVSDEALKQRIKVLRQSLGDPIHTPRYIASVRGVGYRLVAPVQILNDESQLTGAAAGGDTDESSSPRVGGFFQELRRRKVFRGAAAYVIVAWAPCSNATDYLPTNSH